MTRYGITEDYEYNSTHKRERLQLWEGDWFSSHAGVAFSLPKGDGYMITTYNGDKVRVSCPTPRNDANYLKVDEAINKALNDFHDAYCSQSPNHKHQVTDGSCDQCGAKNFN